MCWIKSFWAKWRDDQTIAVADQHIKTGGLNFLFERHISLVSDHFLQSATLQRIKWFCSCLKSFKLICIQILFIKGQQLQHHDGRVQVVPQIEISDHHLPQQEVRSNTRSIFSIPDNTRLIKMQCQYPNPVRTRTRTRSFFQYPNPIRPEVENTYQLVPD